ncbi:hypothetical protein [Arthrobacter sp. M4]|uniref:hypothetical protein n=1 Tax=Arthrobacter sp. M4 TaxID=218160 RepID=UPI001CDD5576|nr:hypothetical protein [Arthrobacter sp. M4]MCA4135646.1 hypothetical protein [Arthrobacter sp. M4]
MGAWNRKQPTKGQALFMGVIALLLATNIVVAVLVEGRPATVLFWIVLAMDLILVAMSLWLYRRAVKRPPTE